MIEYAEIIIGEGAGAACSRCRGAASAARPHELSRVAAAIEAVSWSSSDGPGPNLMLCGFEPFDHPHLPQLIAHAVESGFRRVALRTDAGALTVAANAAGVVSAGVRHIEVVLLGDEARHDALVGRPGSFAAAVAGCRAFLDAGRAQGEHVVVSALVPACRHNTSALTAAVAGAASAGSIAVRIDASALSASDANQVLAALETAAMSMMAGWVGGAPFDVPRPFDRQPWMFRAPVDSQRGGEVS